MTVNLLSRAWPDFDSYELRLLLDKHIGGPGQYDDRQNDPERLYLPLARSDCRIALRYRNEKILAIEPGSAFDSADWARISKEIEDSILAGPVKVGREFSFASFRVQGSWRGQRSGVQILPPPDNAPRAPVEMADHPFILEFPVKASDHWPLTNRRRMREHRKLTLLLNLLLAGGASLQPLRSEHFWANVRGTDGRSEIKWVQQFFFSDLGAAVTDELSPISSEQVEELEPQDYAKVGHDGEPLRVPADLDESICLYLQLGEANRAKFDRAAYWMDMASRQWANSASSSFAALVSAAEALTERGTVHRVYCEKCHADSQHEAPGATERFRAFFEKHAPDASLRSRRGQMYTLRSGILHGSKLMQLDQDRHFGVDPPGWDQTELHRELWSLTKIAARNWLKDPSPR